MRPRVHTPLSLALALLVFGCDKSSDDSDRARTSPPPAPQSEPPSAEGLPTTERPRPEVEASDGPRVAHVEPVDETRDRTRPMADGGGGPKAPDFAPKSSPARPKTPPPAVDEAKPMDPTSAVDGREIFMKKCKTCHGSDGKADTEMGRKHDIPDMTGADWDRKWPKSKIVEIVTRGKEGTKMRAFEGKLTSSEIEAVADFARSL